MSKSFLGLLACVLAVYSLFVSRDKVVVYTQEFGVIISVLFVLVYKNRFLDLLITLLITVSKLIFTRLSYAIYTLCTGLITITTIKEGAR